MTTRAPVGANNFVFQQAPFRLVFGHDWSHIYTRLSWLNNKNGQQNQKILCANPALKDDICFV